MAISKTLRYQILRRDNNTCRTCGRSAPEVKLHVDHVIPEALGGRTEASNLQTLCADCNGGKSATPPDAAQLEQVSADALRWAEAQQIVLAQMLARHRAKESIYDMVDAAWNRWCDGKLERPSDWRQSVDQLLSAGLPLEMFTDAIDVAMANSKVRAQNLWRYACGIGWNRIAEIREATAVAVTPPTPPVSPPAEDDREFWRMYGWNDGRTELAQEILDWFSEDEQEAMLKNARQRALDEGDELEEEGSDSPYLVGKAAYLAFEDAHEEVKTYRYATRELLKNLPPDLNASVMKRAHGDMHDYQPKGFTVHELERWALFCLADELSAGQSGAEAD